jgi:hypothetical protein
VAMSFGRDVDAILWSSSLRVNWCDKIALAVVETRPYFAVPDFTSATRRHARRFVKPNR